MKYNILTVLLLSLFLTSCGVFRKKNTGNNTSKKATNTRVEKLLHVADSYKGTPYKYGGTTKKGIDCSGFVGACYQSVGINLPRRSSDIAKEGKAVSLQKARPGDILVFKTSGNKPSHVGIVYKIKNGEVFFIHSSTSKGVIVSSMNENYWKKHFYQVRRVLE